MTKGMADIIAAHQARYLWPGEGDEPMECECGHWRGDVVEVHAAHIAEELTRAGYGKLDPLAAALADPEGHALVKAIHDRKAEE